MKLTKVEQVRMLVKELATKEEVKEVLATNTNLTTYVEWCPGKGNYPFVEVWSKGFKRYLGFVKLTNFPFSTN